MKAATATVIAAEPISPRTYYFYVIFPSAKARPAMTSPKVTVSLRFCGDELDPHEITALLGLEPTLAHRKGEDLRLSSSVRPARTGLWSYRREQAEGPSASLTFDDQVRTLVSLVSSDVDVWRQLAARFTPELFVGVFLEDLNQGFNVEASTMQELARRGIRLALDIYGTYPKDLKST